MIRLITVLSVRRRSFSAALGTLFVAGLLGCPAPPAENQPKDSTRLTRTEVREKQNDEASVDTEGPSVEEKETKKKKKNRKKKKKNENENENENGKKKKKKPPRKVKYPGSDEYEQVRPEDTFDELGQATLDLRKKQPIHFLGVPMRQIPTDNWLMSELMYDIKPDFIIEAGTLQGGSALYYAAVMEFINPKAKIITIDINEEQIDPNAKKNPLWKKRVRFIAGSSTDEAVIAKVKKMVGKGKKVLVTLDTLHAPEHVSKELELYSQFVSEGSYMILQDTYYEGLPEVLVEFVKAHPEFRRDKKLDQRYIFTKYFGGFLRRQPAPRGPVLEGEKANAADAKQTSSKESAPPDGK